jgi:hypothetical protein
MENDAHKQPVSSTLSERIRERFAENALAREEGPIRVVAAQAQNWPELMHASNHELALGDDDLIRFAVWSASSLCAALFATRRVILLLPEGDDTCAIRCFVLANASLSTRRPLSGFLLKPVEILNCGALRNAPNVRDVRSVLERIDNGAGECRLALFDAFPSTTTRKTRRLRELNHP